ncbi:MAG: hypothetical protein Q9200_004101 [Gallowayella weberi]
MFKSERSDQDYLDFATSSDGECSTKYLKGGYHPTHIGELYKDSRYKIIHKLGSGGFGTVWLARDQEKDRYVALKIIVADKTAENPELKMLLYLAVQDSNHPGRQHLATLLDRFTVDGPNGKHTALVLPLLGPCVEDRAEPQRTRMLEQDVAIRVASQLSQSLSYLHSIGIGHGVQINCQYGKDGDELDYTVYSVDLTKLGGQYVTDNIMLIDLGLSFHLNNPPDYIGIPCYSRAPEVYFDGQVGEASDIWALGCTIYELFAGDALFGTDPAFCKSQSHALSCMVPVLGIFPPEWWYSWDERHQFFEDNGSSKHPLLDNQAPPRDLVAKIGTAKHLMSHDVDLSKEKSKCPNTQLSAQQAASLTHLLSKKLRYSPEDRISAQEVFEDQFLDLDLHQLRDQSLEKFMEYFEVNDRDPSYIDIL